MSFEKLVRDKIPEIIEGKEQIPIIRILDEEEYRLELNKKLQEEVNEYLEDNNIEELADIVEVVYGILNSMNITREEFEIIRKNKADERGGFENRIYLESVK